MHKLYLIFKKNFAEGTESHGTVPQYINRCRQRHSVEHQAQWCTRKATNDGEVIARRAHPTSEAVHRSALTDAGGTGARTRGHAARGTRRRDGLCGRETGSERR